MGEDILQAALNCFRKKRSADTHKGDYGKVLVIAGSLGMTGAAYLCGKAALHLGAGLVYLASPEGLISTYACLLPEAVKLPVGSREDRWFREQHYGELVTLSKGKDVVVIGPGLGGRPETAKLVRALLADPAFAPDAVGIILDADGLNAWEKYDAELAALATKRLILTPHPGEFARLTHLPAEVFAGTLSGATVILKGHRTLTTNGTKSCVNTTGNPGMATAGSGDVLAGMLAGLLATEGKMNDLFTLCTYGVALHGHCGDLAAARYGERFVTAGCLIEQIGELCYDPR